MVVAYGHLGDGNVHLNVSARKYDNEVLYLSIIPFMTVQLTVALLYWPEPAECTSFDDAS